MKILATFWKASNEWKGRKVYQKGVMSKVKQPQVFRYKQWSRIYDDPVYLYHIKIPDAYLFN